jgi:hypothetical protein
MFYSKTLIRSIMFCVALALLTQAPSAAAEGGSSVPDPGSAPQPPAPAGECSPAATPPPAPAEEFDPDAWPGAPDDEPPVGAGDSTDFEWVSLDAGAPPAGPARRLASAPDAPASTGGAVRADDPALRPPGGDGPSESGYAYTGIVFGAAIFLAVGALVALFHPSNNAPAAAAKEAAAKGAAAYAQVPRR